MSGSILASSSSSIHLDPTLQASRGLAQFFSRGDVVDDCAPVTRQVSLSPGMCVENSTTTSTSYELVRD